MAGLGVLFLYLFLSVFILWPIFISFLTFVRLVEYTIFILADRRSTKQQLAQKDSDQSDAIE